MSDLSDQTLEWKREKLNLIFYSQPILNCDVYRKATRAINGESLEENHSFDYK